MCTIDRAYSVLCTRRVVYVTDYMHDIVHTTRYIHDIVHIVRYVHDIVRIDVAHSVCPKIYEICRFKEITDRGRKEIFWSIRALRKTPLRNKFNWKVDT